MRVFISWSGEESRQVADALREWLPLVIQAVKPWVSAADIEKGEAWYSSIQSSLADAQGMGIFCLTQANLAAPWLAFEAGALSIHDRGRVATLLHGVDANSVKPPLSLFQATQSNQKADVLTLMKSVNNRLPDPLEVNLLLRAFEANWDGLTKALSEVSKRGNLKEKAQPKPEEMLEEILHTVRRLERDADCGLEKMAQTVTARMRERNATRRQVRSIVDSAPAERREAVKALLERDPSLAQFIGDYEGKFAQAFDIFSQNETPSK